MGWMYVGLIVGCLITGAALIWGNVREAWVASLLLPLAAMVGFILTRTVGLPQAMALYGLTMEGTHHRGHDDAWNIAAVVAELLKNLRTRK